MYNPAPNRIESPAALETHLLNLFAPGTRARQVADHYDRASVLRADAIHRAKNLAQLATSLANVVTHPTPAQHWLGGTAEMHARALTRTYDELGADCGRTVAVPCLELLFQVATRLNLLFGLARDISTEVLGHEVALPPDTRRVLILMGSELIINALKYGYPDGGPGMVRVTLRERAAGVEMVVEDDGVGITGAFQPGHGSGLLEQLALLEGATMTRSTGSGGGLRVTVGVPAREPEPR